MRTELSTTTAGRVFDEVLDWLVRNGRWINVVRLSTLLKDDRVCAPTVVVAVAAIMMQHDKEPKWRLLAEQQRPALLAAPTPFFQRHGKSLAPLAGERDETFIGTTSSFRSPSTPAGSAR
jgi:hypothetical protein